MKGLTLQQIQPIMNTKRRFSPAISSPHCRTMFLLFAFLLLPFFQSAQDLKKEQVPQSVQKAFEQRYPQIKKTSWEREDGNYEVEFHQNGKEVEICFDGEGNWLQTATEMDPKELPEKVKAFLQTNYTGYKIKELMHIKTGKNETYYELELRKGRSECELKLSAEAEKAGTGHSNSAP